MRSSPLKTEKGNRARGLVLDRLFVGFSSCFSPLLHIKVDRTASTCTEQRYCFSNISLACLIYTEQFGQDSKETGAYK